MINKVQIRNFKSVVDLSLDLGTFNVLIGANGCGKSNILEAIAFGAAASADKLDYEFLGSRGIRVTNPEYMYSAFSNYTNEKMIRLDFKVNNEEHWFELKNDFRNTKKWIDRSKEDYIKSINELIELNKILNEKYKSVIEEESIAVEILKSKKVQDGMAQLNAIVSSMGDRIDNLSFIAELTNYIIYSPEQTSLRKFEETKQIYPLGINGEGLFQYLKELSTKDKKLIKEIKDNLGLIDWFEDFHLSNDLLSNEFALHIKDKYLDETIQFFDQRSTNEGFLYLLFYSTLFISKLTPSFFAIDNIDASLNPKLCMQLTKNLASLAKKHKKQVIVTTQNPAILDGLNLKDDNQRLFVIRRNEEGHTKAQRIIYNAERTMKLSEVWTNGFIGGLPDNF